MAWRVVDWCLTYVILCPWFGTPFAWNGTHPVEWLGVSIAFPCPSTWIYFRWIPSNNMCYFPLFLMLTHASSEPAFAIVLCPVRRGALLRWIATREKWCVVSHVASFCSCSSRTSGDKHRLGKGSYYIMLNRYAVKNHRLGGWGGGGIAICHPQRFFRGLWKQLPQFEWDCLLQIAEVCESLGAERLLDVLKREIYLRSYFSIPDPHISIELHSVLRRMSLAALVSLACAHLGGPFPQLLLKELGNLREIAKHSEDFHWVGQRRDLCLAGFALYNAAVLHSRSLDTQFAQMRSLGLNLMLVNVFIFQICGF